MDLDTINMHLEEMERIAVESIEELFHNTAPGKEFEYERAYYRYLPFMPNKTLQSALSIDREVLCILTNFDDLQARIILVIKEILRIYHERFEKTLVIVVHRDRKGGYKLKNWGRENGLTIIGLLFRDLQDSKDINTLVNNELYNQDPFDITGPVSNDSEFFGRRDEAISFARKIQKGTINSVLGLRKTGKTSLINRVTTECIDKYPDLVIFIDCSRDDIWALNSCKLTKTIYANIKDYKGKEDTYCALEIKKDLSPITGEALIEEIDSTEKKVILIFDEFDYITPSSPTNKEVWVKEFNQFWRQMRVVFQEICRRKRNLSITLCGVNSKWFRLAEIDGVENAAATLIPEEYLKAFQDNAVASMVKALGNRCGLSFDKDAIKAINESTSGIPSWIRKTCSYINRKIPIENRPYEVSGILAEQLIKDYIDSEGISYSKIAIMHLFGVYPELKESVKRFNENAKSISPDEKMLLEQYGIINSKNKYSGLIMRETINYCIASTIDKKIDVEIGKVQVVQEWADEIAELAKRQNIIEKRIREIILEVLRADSRQNTAKGTTKDRLLKCIEEKRRKEFAAFTAEIILEKLFWLEEMSIIKKEWPTLETVFSDQGMLLRNMELLNDRPYAHAKKLEAIDLVAAKNAMKYIEEILIKYDNA